MRSTQTPSNLYFDGYATQVILQNDLGTLAHSSSVSNSCGISRISVFYLKRGFFLHVSSGLPQKEDDLR